MPKLGGRLPLGTSGVQGQLRNPPQFVVHRLLSAPTSSTIVAEDHVRFVNRPQSIHISTIIHTARIARSDAGSRLAVGKTDGLFSHRGDQHGTRPFDGAAGDATAWISVWCGQTKA